MNSQIIDIFSIPIMTFDLGRNYSEKEIEIFKEIKKELQHNGTNFISKRKNLLHHYEHLCDIKIFIENAIKEYVDKILMPKKELHLEITQSFSQYTEKNQFHTMHRHANSIVSGVIYVQTRPSDTITFYNNIYPSLRMTPKEYTVRNSNLYTINCVIGRLILFRSDLLHSVGQVKYDGLRISLAFNTWIKGEKGLTDYVDYEID